jgi:hypothetical protein
MTGLSRRRSRVRVPSLPFLEMPANRNFLLSDPTPQYVRQHGAEADKPVAREGANGGRASRGNVVEQLAERGNRVLTVTDRIPRRGAEVTGALFELRAALHVHGVDAFGPIDLADATELATSQPPIVDLSLHATLKPYSLRHRGRGSTAGTARAAPTKHASVRSGEEDDLLGFDLVLVVEQVQPRRR